MARVRELDARTNFYDALAGLAEALSKALVKELQKKHGAKA